MPVLLHDKTEAANRQILLDNNFILARENRLRRGSSDWWIYPSEQYKANPETDQTIKNALRILRLPPYAYTFAYSSTSQQIARRYHELMGDVFDIMELPEDLEVYASTLD